MKLQHRLALSAAALLWMAPSLSVAQVSATLAVPLERPKSLFIDGRSWSCGGAVCRGAESTDAASQPIGRECGRAAAELGAFTAYSSGDVVLTEVKLATCNMRAKPVAPTSVARATEAAASVSPPRR